MKRVLEIKEELKELANKKEKLEVELENHIFEVAKELKKQYPIVYGRYRDNDPDIWYPDFVFVSKESAKNYIFGPYESRKVVVYALASEELDDHLIYNLIKN